MRNEFMVIVFLIMFAMMLFFVLMASISKDNPIKIEKIYCHIDSCNAIESAYIHEFNAPLNGVIKVMLTKNHVSIYGLDDDDKFFCMEETMHKIKWLEKKN